jgi:hypothetical protein
MVPPAFEVHARRPAGDAVARDAARGIAWGGELRAASRRGAS